MEKYLNERDRMNCNNSSLAVSIQQQVGFDRSLIARQTRSRPPQGYSFAVKLRAQERKKIRMYTDEREFLHAKQNDSHKPVIAKSRPPAHS